MPPTVILPASTSPYLLRDEFESLHNEQDRRINIKLHAINDDVHEVKTRLDKIEGDVHEVKTRLDKIEGDVHEVKTRLGKIEGGLEEFKAEVNNKFDKIDQRFDGIDKRFDGMDKRFDELRVEFLRFSARTRNNNLRNPALQITPIVAYSPEHGIIHPDTTRYPKNASEFYSLRDCRTSRQRAILAYLVDLYDLHDQVRSAIFNSEDELSNDGLEEKSKSFFVNGLINNLARREVVDVLEDIIGLNEHKFIKFRQRASEFQNQPSAATKRSQPVEPTRPNEQPQPSKIHRPLVQGHRSVLPNTNEDVKSSPGEEIRSPGVGYAVNSEEFNEWRMTVRHGRAPAMPSDDGTTTNPITLSDEIPSPKNASHKSKSSNEG